MSSPLILVALVGVPAAAALVHRSLVRDERRPRSGIGCLDTTFYTADPEPIIQSVLVTLTPRGREVAAPVYLTPLGQQRAFMMLNDQFFGSPDLTFVPPRQLAVRLTAEAMFADCQWRRERWTPDMQVVWDSLSTLAEMIERSADANFQVYQNAYGFVVDREAMGLPVLETSMVTVGDRVSIIVSDPSARFLELLEASVEDLGADGTLRVRILTEPEIGRFHGFLTGQEVTIAPSAVFHLPS